MCEWENLSNIALHVPTYTHATLYSTSAFEICLPPFLPLFALLILLHFFLFHPLNPAAAERCGSQCFIYHCVPREDMFHPAGRVAVPDRSQSVC